jgi:putative addiction module component (TIGR02574 family)
MNSQTSSVFDDAMKLGDADRADLAACLLASLDATAQLDPAWEKEIERRLHAIDSGQAVMVPWEEARRRIFGNG